MNRLSFLKTIGAGIAAAVITPKVLTEIPEKAKEIPKDQVWCKKQAKEIYDQYQKDLKNGVAEIRMWDTVIDEGQNKYIITSITSKAIELTSINPNNLRYGLGVNKNVFSEYFYLMRNI
jgi:hypothetical protein